jgi:hypothetical protein
MLTLYGLIASGLPLPIAVPPAAGTDAAAKLAGKDRSQPFPCMDKACGCDSAERCFTNCCCHTPAETLRWAKARGIEPAVLEALNRRVAAAKPVAPAGSCCSIPAAEPACCAEATPATDSRCTVADAQSSADDTICSDSRSLAADPSSRPAHPATDETEQPAARGVVILRAMLACGGVVTQWAAAGVSLPPPRVEFAFSDGLCLPVCCPDDQPHRVSIEPALPPPRDC